jgi:hypothetical protein
MKDNGRNRGREVIALLLEGVTSTGSYRKRRRSIEDTYHTLIIWRNKAL